MKRMQIILNCLIAIFIILSCKKEETKSNEKEILSFILEELTKSAEINSDSATVIAEVATGTDISALTPEISISEKAIISPASLSAVDFSQEPVKYIVTAEDNSTKEWTVTVNIEEEDTIPAIPNTEKEIISFSVEGQIGETTKSLRNLYIIVPFGTDLTSIVPEIIISEGASISPASGEAIDISSVEYIEYTVTAEDGSTNTWKIYISYELITADNTNIRYTGRIDFSDPLKPKFWNPGVYIEAKFSGNYCEIVINDEVLWSKYQNFLEIVIDGTQQIRVQTTKPKNSIKITDLAEGEHTILICKDTEAGIGYLEFVGFRCAGLLPLTDQPSRRLEFIGNSITCGMGNDISAHACGDGGDDGWYWQHNAYMSYGPMIARNLNAQWHLSSVSGIGMIQSCCGNDYEIADVYGNLGLNQNNTAWDFSKYIPDAVTICLGQNDGIILDTFMNKFINEYINFINLIRTNYSNAYIICLTSPMADANLAAHQKEYLKEIVDSLNIRGDNKVSSFFFSKSYNSGCGSHPDIDEHELIADELEGYLKTLLSW